MPDVAIWLALAFMLGFGVGGLAVNELCYRQSRRELAAMKRANDEHNRHWDEEMTKLKARYS